MFDKFFQRRRNRNLTRKMLSDIGIKVKERDAEAWILDDIKYNKCHLCFEPRRKMYATKTYTTPHCEKIIHNVLVGNCCLRCGFVERYGSNKSTSTIYEFVHEYQTELLK